MADVEVGKLKLEADTSGIDQMKDKLGELKDGLPSTGALVDKFVNSLKEIPGAAGLAIVGIGALGAAVVEMVKSTLEANEKLLEMSEATGIAVEKLQPFIAGMELGGVSSDKLTASIGKLSAAVGQALSEPTGKAADAFKQLGISQAELKSGDTEQIMKDAAAGFAKYGDSIEKTAAERELFGKQGPQIVAALQEEAQYTAMVTEAQRDYGTAITEADAKSAKYFNSTLSLAMTMFQGVAQSITKSLLPGLQELVNQFAESGKEGGFMRDMLDGLGATLTLVARILITAIVEPIRLVVTLFKEAGTAIGAFGAAAAAVAHGDIAGARQIMGGLSDDLHKIENDAAAAAAKFESKLWNTDDLEAIEVSAKKIGPAFEAFNASAQKVNDTLEKLKAELAAQVSVQNAAAQGLDAYKKAQDDVAIAILKTQLAQQGATQAQIASAVALKQALDASKQTTDAEVAGWNLVNRLATENIGLTTHQSELQKELAEIAANKGMSESERATAVALAESNAQIKQQLELKKEVNAMSALAANDNAREIASVTLGANALKEFNQQMALRKQYEADLAKDPANADALTAAFERSKQAITDNNTAMNAFNQSAQGALAGASKATADFADETLNANKNAQTLTKSFEDGLANGVVNALNGGKDAMKQFALDMIKQIELMIVKWLELKAIETAASFLSSGGVTGGSSTAMARGGAIQYAASGIVTSATMVAPNTIAGEQGNSLGEAVLPLKRTADGSLGVQVAGGSGGGGSGGGTNITQAFSITVNGASGQDPKALAEQTKAAVKKTTDIANAAIIKQLQQGGVLNPNTRNAY